MEKLVVVLLNLRYDIYKKRMEIMFKKRNRIKTYQSSRQTYRIITMEMYTRVCINRGPKSFKIYNRDDS